MLCEKCNNEKENGNYYFFHYGKLLAPARTEYAGSATINYGAVYDIFGETSAWICDECLKKRQISAVKFWGALAVILLGFLIANFIILGVSSALFSYGIWSLIIWCALLYDIGFIFAPIVILREKGTISGLGEDCAIEACKSKISSTFNVPLVFFNTESYKSLKK